MGCGITWLARSQRPQGSSRVATSTDEARTTVTSAIDVYARALATSGIMFGFDAEHTHANPYERILNPTTVSGLTRRWAYQTGNGINSSPAVGGGVAYVGSQDHNLYAIDAASGSLKWTYQTGNIIDSCPAVAPSICVVGPNKESRGSSIVCRQSFLKCLLANTPNSDWVDSRFRMSLSSEGSHIMQPDFR